jgi:glycine C-acetyltransferase/8-amino-7-oxononanoate synthase
MLLQEPVRVFIDERSHYAVADAAALLGTVPILFRHRDAQHLRELLRTLPADAKQTLLLSDGVFAATGAIAPVGDYVEVLREYGGGAIYLDDAHAFGVLGERGRGTFEYTGFDDTWNRKSPAENVADVRCFTTGTLSKALGAYGGIAAGNNEFIRLLKQSTWYYGASAPIPAAAAAATAAFELLEREPSIRANLARNVTYLKSRLAALGLPIEPTPVPIIPIVLSTAAAMQHLHCELQRQGIVIGYFPHYAGLGENGALRIAVLANHTPAMLDELTDALSRLV